MILKNLILKLFVILFLLYLPFITHGQKCDDIIRKNINLNDSIENLNEELKILRTQQNLTLRSLNEARRLLNINKDSLNELGIFLKKTIKEADLLIREKSNLAESIKKLRKYIVEINLKKVEIEERNNELIKRLDDLMRKGAPLVLDSPFMMSLDEETGKPPTDYPINRIEVELSLRNQMELKVKADCEKLALLEGISIDSILKDTNICEKYKRGLKVSVYEYLGTNNAKEYLHTAMSIAKMSDDVIVFSSSDFSGLKRGTYFFKFRYFPFSSQGGGRPAEVVIGVSDSFRIRR